MINIYITQVLAGLQDKAKLLENNLNKELTGMEFRGYNIYVNVN